MGREERKQFLDVARGISMLCIILGHLRQSSINHFVFTFHVPVFYLITGYFLNTQDTFRSFVKRRFRSLIIPYAVCCVLICISALFFNQFTAGGEGDKALLRYWIIAALYGAGGSYTEPFWIPGIGAIWFLLATFWGSVLLRFLLEKKLVTRILAVFLIFFISKWSTRLCWFPLSIQAGGTALLFMYIGYLGRELVPFVKTTKKEIQIALAVISFWVWVAFIRDFRSFWLVSCDYGRGIIDILGSLCACCCVFLISYWISFKKNPVSDVLAYLGKYSLIILSVHIVELDTFPWRAIGDRLFEEMTDTQFLWFRIIGKFLFIIPVTVFLSKWNVSRRIWGYPVINRESEN